MPIGELVLTAIEGRHLKKLEMGILSKQDPYVIFEFGQHQGKTATHQDASAEPRWQQEGLQNQVKFPINEKSNEFQPIIKIQVMNDNGKKQHKLIGEATLDATEAVGDPEVSKNFEISLKNNKKSAGTLLISVQFNEDKSTMKQKSSNPVTKTKDKAINDEEDDEVQTVAPKKQQTTPENTSRGDKQSSNIQNLKVTVHRAVKLKNLQMLLKQSPYVKVQLLAKDGSSISSAQTKPDKGTNPTWDSSKNNVLELAPGASTPNDVLFEVWEEESLRSDRFICACKKTFSDIMSANGEIPLALQDQKGHDAGTLYVTIESRTSDTPNKIREETNLTKKKQKPEPEPEPEPELEPTAPVSATQAKPKVVLDVPSKERDSDKTNTSKLEYTKGKLVVTAIEGVALKNVQTFGEQDPFVKLLLLPWNLVSTPEKTKNASGVNPKWTSKNVLELEFPGHPGENQTAQLLVEVMDDELMRKPRLIGKATVDIAKYVTQGETSQQADIPLKDKKFRDAGTLKVQFDFHPVTATTRRASSGETEEMEEIEQIPTFEKQGMITVTAKSASLTRSVEMIGKQDPYVQLVLQPWAGEHQQARTKAKNGAGKEPVWGEGDDNAMELFFPGKTTSGEPPSLLVKVMDAQSQLMKDRIIGYGTVDIVRILNLLQKTKKPEAVEITLVYDSKGQHLPCGTCRLMIDFADGAIQPIESGGISVLSVNAPNDFEEHIPLDLYMTVFQGTNLKNRAWFSKQDPYVKITLNPWGYSAQTQPITDGGTNVTWTNQEGNELHIKYPGATNDQAPTLLLECYDSQLGGDRLIGSRLLDSSCFLKSEDHSQEFLVPLVAKGGKSLEKNPGGSIELKIHARKKIGSSVTRCGKFLITLESSTVKVSGDYFGKSDQYVRFRMSPGVLDHAVESVVLNNIGNAAEFNQTLVLPVFDIGIDGLGPDGMYQSLLAEVMDRDTFTQDDLLGKGVTDISAILAGGDAVDPEYSHEIALTSNRKDIGSVYAKIQFEPSDFSSDKIVSGMKTGAGFLRIWVLEARGLKHVGGMMDAKQDPYARVAYQLSNEPAPGDSKSWPPKQKSATHNDAGSLAIWNSYVDVPFSAAQSSFVASGLDPGTIYISVLDEGVVSDTEIGACAITISKIKPSKGGDDFWTTLADKDGCKSGEVRLAVEYVHATVSTELVAKRQELGYVEEGSLHLLVTQLDGVQHTKTKKVFGEILLNGKPCEKIPKVETDEATGKAIWNAVMEIPYKPQEPNPDTEHLMDVPMLTFNLSGGSESKFGVNRSLGKASIPLSAFVSRTNPGESFERRLMICQGESFNNTYLTLKVIGTYSSKNAKQAPKTNTTEPPRKGLSGRFHMKILAGKNLKNRDTFGKQDPLVKCLMEPGGDNFLTATCTDGGLNPVWTDTMNNSHIFLVEDAGSAVVHLVCEDEDQTTNDIIGKVHIPLWPLISMDTGAASATTQPLKKVTPRSPREVTYEKLMTSAFPKKESMLKQVFEISSSLIKSPKWDRYCALQYKKLPTGNFNETATTEPGGRLFYLTKFYTEVDSSAIEKIDDPVAKATEIHEKYPDNDRQNAELFSKLFKKYYQQPCPEGYWKPEQESSQKGSKNDVLTPSLVSESINVICEDISSLLPRGKTGESLNAAEIKQTVDLFMKKTGKGKPAPFDINVFKDIAALTLCRVVLQRVEAGTQFEKQSHSTAANSTRDAAETTLSLESKKMWWGLKNDQGDDCGLVQVETRFTNDWVPESREAPPELLHPGVLWIQVTSADFTADKDIFGKQDPYVSARWSTQPTKSEQRTKPKSNADLHVEWAGTDGLLKLEYDPSFAFEANRLGQALSIVIQAKDQDMLTSELIGETKLPLIFFARHENLVFTRSVPIVNDKKGSTTRAGTISLRMQYTSTNSDSPSFISEGASITPGPISEPGRLIVMVKNARNLKDVQWIGRMDPVARVRIWPENHTSATKVATDAEKNPSWNETFSYDSDDFNMGLVDLTVSTGNTTIGSVQIAVADIVQALAKSGSSRIEDWYELVQMDKNGKAKRTGQISLAIQTDTSTPDEDYDDVSKTGIAYVHGPGELHIKIKQACDLGSNSKQDPYVALSSVNWRKDFSTKTKTDENGGTNPMFNFSSATEMQWGPKDKSVPSLNITIKDRNMMKDTTIQSSMLNLAPWLLTPGQISSAWLPTYSSDAYGPYEYKPKKGCILVQMQYLPKADFPGKPKLPLERMTLTSIASPHEPRIGEIHLQVLSCRNLVDVQAIGKQDPYVKITRIAGGGTLDGKLHFSQATTTTATDGGSNPEWNEDLLLSYDEKALELTDGIASTPILLVEVWDSNSALMGDKLIGKVLIPVFPCLLDDHQVLDSWYPLTSASGSRAGEIHLGVQFRREGETKREIPSETPENTLNVVVVRARKLHDVGDGLLNSGAIDPFVQVEFIGHDRVVKTQVAQDQGTEPVFNERLKLPGCMPDARGSYPRLRCQVFDSDPGGKSTFIGQCEFSLTKSIMGDDKTPPEAHEQWLQLLDSSLKSYRGELLVILKRGPFDGDMDDEDTTPSSVHGSKMIISLKEMLKLTDKDGKEPSKAIFRCTSYSGTKVVSYRDCGVGDAAVVLPIRPRKSENEPPVSVQIAAIEKRWSIRGLRPVVIASAPLPKLEKLIQGENFKESPLSLALYDPSTDGLELGRVELGLRYFPTVTGQIRVTVVSADQIRKQDWIGKNDLRVDLKVLNGGKKCSYENTTTKDGAGDKATWNEEIHLLYSNEDELHVPLLSVTVVDVDSMKQNDICGSVTIPLIGIIEQALSMGVGGQGKLEKKSYDLDKGGTVTVGVHFLPNSNIFKEKKIEENKQIMELKRMWNMIDVNHDGRLTREELIEGLASVPDCVKFLGLEGEMFRAENIRSKTTVAAIGVIFKEMNSNDDEIVDFKEFSDYVESKPQRDALRREREQADRRKARELYDAEQRRNKEREAAMNAKRLEMEREELERRRAEEMEEQARKRADAKKREELARIRREEELAKLAEKRAAAELEKARLEAKEAREAAERLAAQKKKQQLDRKRPEDVMQWRTKDVVEWLAHDLELPEYSVAFSEGAVDGPLLVELGDEDMMEGLGIKNMMHRRKIMNRAARLLQIHAEKFELNQTSSKTKTKTRNLKSNSMSLGERTLLQMKLAKQAAEENARREKEDEEAKNRRRMERFEYSSPVQKAIPEHFGWDDDEDIDPPRADVVARSPPQTSLDDFDSFSDLDDDDESPNSGGDESAFRDAMSDVRSKIIQHLQENQVTLPPLNDAPKPAQVRSRKREETIPMESFSSSTKLRSNNFSRTEGASSITQSEMLNRSLGSVKKLDSDMPNSKVMELIKRRIMDLGKILVRQTDKSSGLETTFRAIYESFLQDESILSKKGLFSAIRDFLRLDLSNGHFNHLFNSMRDPDSDRISFDSFYRVLGPYITIPEEATLHEILQIVRKGIHSLIPKNMKDDKSALRDVYDTFLRLRNQTDNHVDKLSRLKFQGGLKSLLKIDLTYSQFDQLFRHISPQKGDGTFGTIEFSEFYRAFVEVDPSTETTTSVEGKRMRKSLFQVCSTLARGNITLTQAFHGFDRNGSGEVSTAEFVSVMQALCPQLDKAQIYEIMRCIDVNSNLKIGFDEFMQFWYVVFQVWAQYLGNIAGLGKMSKKKHGVSPRDMDSKIEEIMMKNFGKKFMARMQHENAIWSGPFSSLLTKIGIGGRGQQQLLHSPNNNGSSSMLNRSAFPKDEASNYRSQARTSIGDMLGSYSEYDNQVDQSPRGTAFDAIRAARKRRDQLERSDFSNTDYGRNELQRIRMTRTSEVKQPRRERNTTSVPPVVDMNDQFRYPNVHDMF